PRHVMVWLTGRRPLFTMHQARYPAPARAQQRRANRLWRSNVGGSKMHPSIIRSHSIAAAWATLFIGITGCTSAPIGAPVDAPRLVVGDHWQYRVIDNLRRGT